MAEQASVELTNENTCDFVLSPHTDQQKEKCPRLFLGDQLAFATRQPSDWLGLFEVPALMIVRHIEAHPLLPNPIRPDPHRTPTPLFGRHAPAPAYAVIRSAEPTPITLPFLTPGGYINF